MAIFKNESNGMWYTMFRYTDWKGERKQKCKRGFATKREALDYRAAQGWESNGMGWQDEQHPK